MKDDPFVRGGGSNPVWESKNTCGGGGARAVLLEVFDREFLAENRLIAAGEMDISRPLRRTGQRMSPQP